MGVDILEKQHSLRMAEKCQGLLETRRYSTRSIIKCLLWTEGCH